jgi:hypothetical protein
MPTPKDQCEPTMQGVGRRFRLYEMCTVKALQGAAERHLSVNHRLHKSRLAVKIAVRTSNKHRPVKHGKHLEAPDLAFEYRPHSRWLQELRPFRERGAWVPLLGFLSVLPAHHCISNACQTIRPRQIVPLQGKAWSIAPLLIPVLSNVVKMLCMPLVHILSNLDRALDMSKTRVSQASILFWNNIPGPAPRLGFSISRLVQHYTLPHGFNRRMDLGKFVDRCLQRTGLRP